MLEDIERFEYRFTLPKELKRARQVFEYNLGIEKDKMLNNISFTPYVPQLNYEVTEDNQLVVLYNASSRHESPSNITVTLTGNLVKRIPSFHKRPAYEDMIERAVLSTADER